MPKKKQYSEFQLRQMERRAAARRVVYLSIGKFLLVAFGISFIIWGLLFSPLFRINQTQLLLDEGKVNMIDMNAVNQKLDDLKADSAPRLLMLSTNSVEDDFKKIHGVKDASVAKSWPGELVIMLTPKDSVARVGDDLIDEEGGVLGSYNSLPEPRPVLPTLNIADSTRDDVMRLLIAVRHEPLFAGGISEITATGRDDIAFKRADGITIFFGNINRLTLKLEAAEQMLKQDLGGRKTIDLSSPVDPVAR